MNKYLQIDTWKIIENEFVPDRQRASESLFSIGNGAMGQRANFEERYSGDSLQGSYAAGVYYPDKTRVGWWKIGYPEYFAKVINSVNWIGINIKIDGVELDLASCEVVDFKRVLDMRRGTLERNFVVKIAEGKTVEVSIIRFLSIVETEVGAIKYSVKPLDFDAEIEFTPYLDFNVKNEDSNYDEEFWSGIKEKAEQSEAYICAKTNKLDFHVGSSMKVDIKNVQLNGSIGFSTSSRYAENKLKVSCSKGQICDFYKYASVVSSFNHTVEKLEETAHKVVNAAFEKGFDALLEAHTKAWEHKWEESDITIEGDDQAQQGIRFNIFQLNQTYTGEDERLNIGPKGFTGEKYGGSTYWDTEAFCLPFYLSTAPANVARNLLLYRYKQLDKAIENAAKLGIKNGAALYPMVTMNGEECHNEWEITFEEIHRNGAIAHAIYNYVSYNNDYEYLADYGLEVLIAISRYWSGRVNYSTEKKKYVILGVTGPNEYENNVNNNWYTNYIASWCMEYTMTAMDYVKQHFPEKFNKVVEKTNFELDFELLRWQDIVADMYFPMDDPQGIFLQQDGYLDKEQKTVSDLEQAERPINQHWSWDRILRSCYIKQADVMQGIYFFEDHFDIETIIRNYEFYEPRTVHESSLSPCIHSVIASKINKPKEAYELYLRTARLDLDDYNKEVDEGLHITSMAGTWLAIVQGFGGMRVKNDMLHFDPQIPEKWGSFSFKIRFRNNLLKIVVAKDKIHVDNQEGEEIKIKILGSIAVIGTNRSVEVDFQNA